MSTRDLRKCRTIKSAIPKTSYLSISHQMLTSLPLQLSPVSILFFCSSSASFLCPQNQQSVRWPRHRFFFFFFFPAFLKYLFHNNVGKEELNMLRANHQTHLRYGSRLARSLGAFITFPWRKIFSGEKNRFRTTTVRRTESC